MKSPSFGWERLGQVFYRNQTVSESNIHNQEQYTKTITAINYDVVALYLSDSERIECYNNRKELMFSIDVSGLKHVQKIDYNMDHFYIITSSSIRVIESIEPLVFHDHNFDLYLKELRYVQNGSPSNIESSIEDQITNEIWDYKNGYILSTTTQSVFKFTGSEFFEVLANNDQYTLLARERWDAQNEHVVFLNTDSVLYYRVDTGELETIESDTAWDKCQIAPSLPFLVLYNDRSNKLSIVSLSTKKNMVTVSLNYKPADIKWCGNDAVACSNSEDEEINIYGPTGKYITFWYPDHQDSVPIKVETTDFGLKVYSSESVSLISKVDSSSSNIFKIGSTSSSAILFDCLQLLKSGFAPRAIENLKAINLEECVEECINAALYEFDASLQKQLLTAASFGKASILKDNNDESVLEISRKFVEACNTLRFLNNLKTILGYQISIDEFKQIGIQNILNHLLQCNKFHECLKLSEFFPETESRYKLKVMYDYSVKKILASSDKTDDELYHEIVLNFNKLNLTENFEFSKLSAVCYKEGRLQLSKQMILKDKNIRNQIRPLLNLEEDELPLQKAHASGSHVLELYVLLKLQKKLTNAQLFRLMALNLDIDNNILMRYNKNTQSYGLSFDFYKQIDDYKNLSNLIMEKNKSQKDMVLQQINELYKKDSSLRNQFKQYSTRELELIQFQKELESKYEIENAVGLTCHETFKILLNLNQNKIITNFLKKFDIDDKVFYAIKSDLLIEQKRFDELWELCNERRFHNNMKQLFKKLKRKGFPLEASRYVSLMKKEPYESKMSLYLECSDYKNAIDLAIQASDHDSLLHILELTSDTNMKKFIQEQIVRL